MLGAAICMSLLPKGRPGATERTRGFSGSPGAQVRQQLHLLQEIQGVPCKHQFLVFLESQASQVGLWGLGGLGDPKKRQSVKKQQGR